MNRYMIGNLIVGVTFYSDNVVNMKGLCTIHIEDKEFNIPLELLKLIAEPAP